MVSYLPLRRKERTGDSLRVDCQGFENKSEAFLGLTMARSLADRAFPAPAPHSEL